MNDKEIISYYLEKIQQEIYQKVPYELFEECLEEGFPYEIDDGEKSENWNYIKLDIKPQHIKGLISLDSNTIELFNELDIKLKDLYNLKIINLINYNTGEVFIFKHYSLC